MQNSCHFQTIAEGRGITFKDFWNRYEKTGPHVLESLSLHGSWLPSKAGNGTKDEKEVFDVTHVSIVDDVKAELEEKLKQ
jgi:hypothetical protein